MAGHLDDSGQVDSYAASNERHSLQGHVPIQAVPTTLVLDRQGRVFARILGLAERSTLRALIDDALEEPAP